MTRRVDLGYLQGVLVTAGAIAAVHAFTTPNIGTYVGVVASGAVTAWARGER